MDKLYRYKLLKLTSKFNQTVKKGYETNNQYHFRTIPG